jgi:hypothetical protein
VRALASAWLPGGHSQAMPIHDLDWRISTRREYAPILRRSGRQRRLLGAYVGQIGSDYTRQFVIVSRLRQPASENKRLRLLSARVVRCSGTLMKTFGG